MVRYRINEKPKSISEHQIKYDKEMPGIGYSLFKEYLKSSTAWRTGFQVTKGLVYSGSSKVAKNKPEVKIRIRLMSRLIRRVMNLLYFPRKTRQMPNPIAIKTVSITYTIFSSIPRTIRKPHMISLIISNY